MSITLSPPPRRARQFSGRSIKSPVYVALYFVTREFGGPEEGGWYYTRQVLQGKPKVFASMATAEAFQDRAQRIMDAVHEENSRPLSSVLSQGEYRVSIYQYAYDGYPPVVDPAETPRYE